MIYATRGLASTVLRLASERDPDSVTMPLAVTRAGDLPGTDLPEEVPVFTHFYMPETGNSVTAVFGVDLGTPLGQTEGRFVSHPTGRRSLSTRDDLHEVVFVGVPPWAEDDLAVYDRAGRRRDLELLDVEPPEERHALETDAGP